MSNCWLQGPLLKIGVILAFFQSTGILHPLECKLLLGIVLTCYFIDCILKMSKYKPDFGILMKQQCSVFEDT